MFITCTGHSCFIVLWKTYAEHCCASSEKPYTSGQAHSNIWCVILHIYGISSTFFFLFYHFPTSCNQSAGLLQTDTSQKRHLVEWSIPRALRKGKGGVGGWLVSDECEKRRCYSRGMMPWSANCSRVLLCWSLNCRTVSRGGEGKRREEKERGSVRQRERERQIDSLTTKQNLRTVNLHLAREHIIPCRHAEIAECLSSVLLEV